MTRQEFIAEMERRGYTLMMWEEGLFSRPHPTIRVQMVSPRNANVEIRNAAGYEGVLAELPTDAGDTPLLTCKSPQPPPTPP